MRLRRELSRTLSRTIRSGMTKRQKFGLFTKLSTLSFWENFNYWVISSVCYLLKQCRIFRTNTKYFKKGQQFLFFSYNFKQIFFVHSGTPWSLFSNDERPVAKIVKNDFYELHQLSRFGILLFPASRCLPVIVITTVISRNRRNRKQWSRDSVATDVYTPL